MLKAGFDHAALITNVNTGTGGARQRNGGTPSQYVSRVLGTSWERAASLLRTTRQPRRGQKMPDALSPNHFKRPKL